MPEVGYFIQSQISHYSIFLDKASEFTGKLRLQQSAKMPFFDPVTFLSELSRSSYSIDRSHCDESNSPRLSANGSTISAAEIDHDQFWTAIFRLYVVVSRNSLHNRLEKDWTWTSDWSLNVLIRTSRFSSSIQSIT